MLAAKCMNACPGCPSLSLTSHVRRQRQEEAAPVTASAVLPSTKRRSGVAAAGA